VNVGDIVRYHEAGTVHFRGTDVLAVRDTNGEVWIAIEDFLPRYADWICSHPLYFDVPRCPAAVTTNESGDVLLVAAKELGQLLGVNLGDFTLAPNPAATTVAKN